MKKPRTFKEIQNHPHVQSAHSESNDPQWGTDYWVYLNFPYISRVTETQTIHEYGMKDTLREFNDRELNYAYFMSDYWIERPESPEQKQTADGQLELPLEEIKYKEELKKYQDKISKVWTECYIHAVENDQSKISELYKIKKNFSEIPNYSPDWRDF
tara:strand:+ start:33 stop:503 length:471 start_codon:yes stop_codon:yes gene_type:complete